MHLLKAGKQTEFHSDRYAIFARLISAGTGSGKTRAGIQEAWLWTWECPKTVGLLFEPTYGMIKRNLIPALEEILGCSVDVSPLIRQFNRADNKITLINGTVWWLLSLNEPERAEGINADWIWADEFRLVGGSGPASKRKQQTAWNVIIRRLRGSTLGKYPTGLWITTTPDEPGSLLHTKFERPDTRIPDSKVYRWTIFDNPFLPEQYVEEVKRTHIEGTGLYNRFVLGLFSAVAAGSFNFDSSKHCFKKIPDLTVFKEVIGGADWGWTNPSCLLAIGIDGDDRAWVLDEYYKSQASLEEIAQVALEMQKNWNVSTFYCDRSSPRNISMLQDYGLDAVADKSKRDEGIQMLGSRFIFQEDEKARLYVHEDCVNLISELQVYDENVKQYDHAVDALRYALANYQESGGQWDVSFAKRPY